jgi:hypothetical protein
MFLVYPNKPKTLFSCFNKDGTVNFEQFRQYMQSVNEETVMYRQRMLSSEEEEASSAKPMNAVRRKRKAVLEYYDDDNLLQTVKPHESTWWYLYCRNPTVSERFLIKFRRRFRLPYEQYLELVEDSCSKHWFPQWENHNCAGMDSSPIE